MRAHCLPDWRTHPELSLLKDLTNPPTSLFYRGEWKASLFDHCIAIVGSRRMTEYGRRVIEKIVPKLVFEKKTIVSGFMYGVDQYAHSVCIENGGKTIAVLGWGINRPLEDTERKLAEKIMNSGGLILSEWDDQPATLWTFPVRNRIVAAISKEVIVIEAGVRSGSLITANIAKKLKRPLWAVPGPITSHQSSGTNALIADGLAQMWIECDVQVTMRTHDPILTSLADEALSASELARKLGKPIAEIGAQLSMLAIGGQLTERGGKYYVSKN